MLAKNAFPTWTVPQPICVKGFPEFFAINLIIELNEQFLNIRAHIL